MEIILAGGGSSADERPLSEIFASWMSPPARLLYWPVALRGIRTFESCLEWVTSTFAPLGISDISMWTDLTEHHQSELDAFDGVYIGGGNTFSLLDEMRKSGFDHFLKTFATHGKPVYGGSAGAAVLGLDIRTVNHIDHNKTGMTNTFGLDLAHGHSIWPHYEPGNDELIYAYMREHGQSVIALSERSGIVIEDGMLYSAGFEPALLFDEHGKHKMASALSGNDHPPA